MEQQYLDGATSPSSASVESGRQHAAVIGHQDIARPQQRGQLAKDVVANRRMIVAFRVRDAPPLGVTAQHQQTRAIAGLGGRLSDQVKGQIVVVAIGDKHIVTG